ncbi:MAG: hypothetical protein IKH68_02710, partial [Erysipelotrichaceae bacterium]|nr:hypothetical protein [Erysipelotrichaceae bacterium]
MSIRSKEKRSKSSTARQPTNSISRSTRSKTDMAKIGIYCGSFNPVHNGHIAIAKACIEEGLVDKVR